MKKLLLALALLLTPSLAAAQCTGVFPANTICGNLTGSPAPPKAVSFSSSGVVGPGSSTVGHFATWANTTGNLLADFDLYGAANTFTNTLALTGIPAGTQTKCLGLDSSNNVVTVSGSCSSASIPVGTSLNYRGLTAPSGFLVEGGQAVSRATYSDLFAAITFSSTASTTSGSKVITGISDTSTLGVGMPVGGSANITCGDTIASVDSSTQITLTSNNASGTGSITLTVAPYGVGNCSTTFNVPDSRGRLDAGNDNPTGGAGAAGRITVGGSSCRGTVPGTGCGAQSHVQTTAELAAHSHANTLTDPGHTHAFRGSVQTGSANFPTVDSNNNNLTASSPGVVSATTGITINNVSEGSSTAMPIINPILVTNRIIKY